MIKLQFSESQARYRLRLCGPSATTSSTGLRTERGNICRSRTYRYRCLGYLGYLEPHVRCFVFAREARQGVGVGGGCQSCILLHSAKAEHKSRCAAVDASSPQMCQLFLILHMVLNRGPGERPLCHNRGVSSLAHLSDPHGFHPTPCEHSILCSHDHRN